MCIYVKLRKMDAITLVLVKVKGWYGIFLNEHVVRKVVVTIDHVFNS
jgi:hypothetical protein